MSFLEWLTGMALMFWGWMFPISFGLDYINNQNGNIFIGILICFSAVPIEIILYRLYKRFKEKREQKERSYNEAQKQKLIQDAEKQLKHIQELEQARIIAERDRLERIKASPIKNLSPLEFEEFTKEYLEDRNYKQVHLTSTSGDFGADVIAIAPDNVRVCIQCKKYSNPVGVAAIQEIYSAKAYYNCGRASVVTTSVGFTKPAIDFADKVKVSLFVFDDYKHEFKPINHYAHSI